MERWKVPAAFDDCVLHNSWNTLVQAALKQHVTGIWLLTSPERVGLVYFRRRKLPLLPADQHDPQKVAAASLSAIESMAPLGSVFDDQGWMRVFDRSSWCSQLGAH